MGHPSTNGYITIPDGTDIVSRAAYEDNLEEIDAALSDMVDSQADLRQEMAYYDIKMLAGSNVIADWDTSADVRAVGTMLSPRGGICFSWPGNAMIAGFFMPVKNVTAGDVTITINIPRTTDKLYYQIDDETRIELVPYDMTNTTGSITIPTGEHVISFYLLGNNSYSTGLAIADWLTTDIVYNRT
jgi:hypothetical protein